MESNGAFSQPVPIGQKRPLLFSGSPLLRFSGQIPRLPDKPILNTAWTLQEGKINGSFMSFKKGFQPLESFWFMSDNRKNHFLH